MFYKIIIFLSFFLVSAQIDKLSHKSLNDSIVKHLELNPNKALDFGFEVLKTADIVNPNRELVSTYNLIGQLLTNKKLYAEALSYFSEALKSYQLIPKSELIEKNPLSGIDNSLEQEQFGLLLSLD